MTALQPVPLHCERLIDRKKFSPMPPSSFPGRNFQRINDALHEALSHLEDFKWGSWWLRCIEFHFEKGNYVAGDSFGWHLHKEIQMEIPLDAGEFQFFARQFETVKIRRSDVYIIPPDVVHRWKCLRSGPMIGLSLAIVPRADSIIMLPGSALRPEVLKPPELENLLANFCLEFGQTFRTGEFAVKRLACWMYLLITQVLGVCPLPVEPSGGPEMLSSRPSRSQRVVTNVMRYIDANLAGDLTVSRFAKAFGLSTRQIHRLFIEVTGMSCHRYVMDRRLEAARSMLQAYAHLSIKEVAHAAGFASTAHFSSKFKKAYGFSPSEFSAPETLIISKKS